jgi:hypothetical protein
VPWSLRIAGFGLPPSRALEPKSRSVPANRRD